MMTESRALPLAQAQEPCCWPVCQYNPNAVRKMIELIAQILADGRIVADDVKSHMSPARGYEMGRAEGGFGPRCEAFWAIYVSQIERAWAAGKKTPEEISDFLCPFNSLGADDE